MHVEKHDAYSNRKNDIAILYLKHDVQVTGELEIIIIDILQKKKS